MDFSSQEQRRKMVLLGGLYVTQYLGLGFISTAVPAILRSNGMDLDQLGPLYFFGIVWALKFLWSPLIDRYGLERLGHYRGWLIGLQSLIILLLVGAAFLDVVEQFDVLIFFFAGVSLFSATQDIASDALAVNMLKPEERGSGNSVQVAGGFIGNILGGGVVLIAYEYLGWTASMLILAAGTALPLLNILRYDEPPSPASFREDKVGMKDILRFFRRPGIGRWVPILFTYTLGISSAYSLLNPMLVDVGWSLDQVGIAINVVGSIASILGAAFAGWIVARIGRRALMVGANGMIIVSLFLILHLAGGGTNPFLIYGSIIVMLFSYGAGATILFTLTMDKTDPARAGTEYTLQYALSSVLGFIMAGLTVTSAQYIGYTGVISIGIGLASLVFLLVWSYDGYEPVPFEEELDIKEELDVAEKLDVVGG